MPSPEGQRLSRTPAWQPFLEGQACGVMGGLHSFLASWPSGYARSDWGHRNSRGVAYTGPMGRIQPFSRDTSPEVQALLVERWRTMSPAEKASLVDTLTLDCIALACAGIRDRHPDASPEQVRFFLGVRCLGLEVATRALRPASSEI